MSGKYNNELLKRTNKEMLTGTNELVVVVEQRCKFVEFPHSLLSLLLRVILEDLEGLV